MKTNFTAKLFGLTLVTALTLTILTACGDGGAATASSGTASGSALQSGDGGSVGTVLLSVNPEIEMDYDEVGNVVALTGLNEDGKAVLASYTGYEGKPCTTVVGELVDEINAGRGTTRAMRTWCCSRRPTIRGWKRWTFPCSPRRR